ncbi:MAG TPA: serine/threonine-protein kinase, partial [Kofleriaceae bacterium]
ADVVKVLDFGIAKTTEAEAARERRLTSPGMAMGTPEYMSPEQAAGRPADARCDVYALGAIMYEMVTGIPPSTGDNFMEILTKKATVDPRPPILERAELPAQVSELVMAAMARNPDDRPQTMEALEYELNKCLSGRGVAVAQILGMTTDAHVVATLNPGLSMRTFDDAVVVPRAQTASPVTGMSRAGTHSGMSELPAMWSGPSMSTNQHALMARQGSDAGGSYPGQSMSSIPMRLQSSPAIQGLQAPALSDPGLPVAPPMVAPQPRRSALNVLGWLTFAAVLFGAIGSLLYIALGERFARRQQETIAAGSIRAVDGKADLHPDGSGGPSSSAVGSAAAGSGSSSVVEPPASVAVRPDAGPGADRSPAKSDAEPSQADHKLDDRGPRKRGSRPVTAKRPQVAVVDNGDPRQLLKQAKELETARNWDEARAVWQRLEKNKTYHSEALYHQAWAAFQSNDTAAASKLALQVGSEPGRFQIQAKFLYADALYRQGELERAKEFYKGLYKQLGGNDRALAAKKIVACNKQLKLPDSDGIN